MAAPHAAVKAKVAQRPTESVSLGAGALIVVGILTDKLNFTHEDAVLIVTTGLAVLPSVVTYLVGLVRGEH